MKSQASSGKLEHYIYNDDSELFDSFKVTQLGRNLQEILEPHRAVITSQVLMLFQSVSSEDEMVGWHHRLNGLESEQAPRVGEGQEAWCAAILGVAKIQA